MATQVAEMKPRSGNHRVRCGLCGDLIVARGLRIRVLETDVSSQATGHQLASLHVACWDAVSRAIASMRRMA